MKVIRNLEEKKEALRKIVKYIEDKGEMSPISSIAIGANCGGETAIKIFRLLYKEKYFYKITTGIYSITTTPIPKSLTIEKLLKHE